MLTSVRHDRDRNGSTATRRLRLLSQLVLVLLVAQFLVGMVVNLFVAIPKSHPGASPPEYFSGSVRSVTWALFGSGLPWLELHVVIGILLFAGAAALLVAAIRRGRRGFAIASSVGLVGVIAGGFNGASFLNYHEDFSSLLMAGGFALAALAYIFGLYGGQPELAADDPAQTSD